MIRNLRFPCLAWVALCALVVSMPVLADGETFVLTHGGDGLKPLSRRADLRIPSGAMAATDQVTLTSLGAQSLPGLLPLGWSPLACAEIVSTAVSLTGAELTFDVPRDELIATGQTLTAVRYQEDRDEWRVLVAAVNVSFDGKATIAIAAPGAYALVYPDKAPHLQSPPAPSSGGVLTGVADPCATGDCPPLAAKNALELTPPAVLPTQRTVGTLSIDGSGAAKFPSGTAVQAYVDEELHLADGTRDVVSPFVTDLLLYRNLAGDTGVAEFHLAPSARAAEVVLEVGYDHIRIVPYLERVDRGALIGPEGGRVPADELVAVEIPAAATTEALKATATSIRDFAPFGTIAGYRIVGGLSLSLQWASAPAGEEVNPVELLKPARATFTVNDATLPSQLILVEVLEGTPYGRVYRLASQITALEGGTRFSTKTIDRAVLPVDGIIREGTYLLLAPAAPIAFATGTVHLGVNGPAANGARVLTPGLGVVDVTRLTGIFALPVPAAPFALVPRTASLGDGVPYQHPTAPPFDAVIDVGELAITAQLPQVVSTSPSNNATGVGVAAFVQVTFSRDIDPTSASITVSDARGTVSVSGPIVTWKLATGELFEPGKRYTVTVGPTTRALNGAVLGYAHVFSFETVGNVTSGEVHAEKIRITIPDAAGNSRIIGDPGALPGTGWSAVPVRRGIDFASRPTANAAADGSFSMTVAGVTIADQIDLRVVNTAGAVAAIIPLTPFTSEDGRAFVAPVSTGDVKFTSVDAITIIVPPGAFDEPKLIRVEPADRQAFAGVPQFEEELRFAAAFRLEFEGKANKRLQVEMPVPAGWQPSNNEVVLGWLGQSARGPRVMIVDTVRVEGGKFTTTEEPSAGVRAPRTNTVLTGREVKKFLLGTLRAGVHSYFDMRVPIPMGWVVMQIFQIQADIFWDIWKSLFASELYLLEGRGRIAIPVLASTPFKVEGVDAATGMKVFAKAYANGDDGVIESPYPDVVAPYPVFAVPTRIEQVELQEDETLIRSFKLTLAGGNVSIESNSAEPLPEGVKIQALNTRNGASTPAVAVPPGGAFTLGTIPAERGDRIVLITGVKDEGTDAAMSVVFNEPIDTSSLQNDIQLDAYTSTGKVELTKHLLFDVDSNGRRIHFDLPGDQLIRGARYEITLKNTIKDLAGNALKRDLTLSFETRPVEGIMGSFNIPSGAIRDIARYGNILFVSALDGGLLAYDTSDPANLTSAPMSFVPAAGPDVMGYDQHWAVATDHHGRVYGTGFLGNFGVIRGYRVEDFLSPACTQFPSAPAGSNCNFHGAAIVGWRPGFNTAMPLSSTTILSDRVEATPRKLQLLVQDDEQSFDNLAALKAAHDHIVVGTWPSGTASPDFEKLHVRLEYAPSGAGPHYKRQRVTIENVTRNLRWSADLVAGAGPALVRNVIAHRSDKLKIYRNLHTYGVISQFGHGVGMFDLNAVETNDLVPFNERVREQIIATRADYESSCAPIMPMPAGIADLMLSPEAAVVPSGDSSQIIAFAPHVHRGVLGIGVSVQQAIADAGKNAECVYRDDGFVPYDRATGNIHPRLQEIKDAFAAAGRSLVPRYQSVSAYRGERFGEPMDYVLAAAGDLGMLMLQVGPPPMPFVSDEQVLAGVVWVPNGVVAVRHIPRTHMAVMVDTTGRALLVDLTRVDERYDNDGLLTSGLFATTRIALLAPGASGQIGVDDPRIIWKSEPGLMKNTMAPLVDPLTGVLIAGDVMERAFRAVPAIDPRIRVLINAGGGTMREVSGPTPLGYAPRAGMIAASDADASAAAFRFQVTLPGGAAKALASVSSALQLAVESEWAAGFDVAQTPPSLPRAHLRESLRTAPPNNADPRPATFVLGRDLPAELEEEIWYQEGASTYTSDWIVAIADPRASEKWKWPSGANKNDAGCVSCERPQHLRGKTEADGVFELWTAGRYIAVRPEGPIANNVLVGTPYEYLGRNGRLEARFTTTPARKVRPTEVLVPAHNPPVADGMLQETHYIHSGEVETAAVDMNAGGRAGVDVVLARTYRSRTIGGTDLGEGWDSPMYRFLIQRPSGEVEYHDGAGEIWVFTFDSSIGAYVAPNGLFVKLARTERGFALVDQQWRIAEFNEIGQLTSESDEFYDAAVPDSGNRVRYLYDERGRLARIIDPLNRATELTYWGPDAATTSCPYGGATPCGYPGRLREAKTKWRKRSVVYEYDAFGRLTKVQLPEVKAGAGVPAKYDHTGSGRPKIEYTYESVAAPAPNEPPASQPYTNFAELAGNLTSIKDPEQVKLSGAGQKRVTFAYDLSTDPLKRDRNTSQTWGSGETATFTVGENIDVVGQRRTYALTGPDELDKRRHFLSKTLHDVTVVRTAEATLPDTDIGVAETGEVMASLVTTYGYEENGLLATQTLPNGLAVTNTWIAANGAPGKVLQKTEERAPTGAVIETQYVFDTLDLATANVSGVGRRDSISKPFTFRDNETPSRNRSTVKSSDLNVSSELAYDKQGRVAAAGTSDPGGAGGMKTEIDYYPDSSLNAVEAGRPWHVRRGGGAVVFESKYALSADGEETETTTDLVRGVVTRIVRDIDGRVVSRRVTAPGGTSGLVVTEELFGYNADGRTAYHSRKQTGLGGDVVTTTRYDSLGRVSGTSTYGGRVLLNPSAPGSDDFTTLDTKTVYDLGSREITDFDAHRTGEDAIAPRTTKKLDRLGRVQETRRTGAAVGTGTIRSIALYDIHGGLAYTSDLSRTASITQHDHFGRPVATLLADGTRAHVAFNEWDEVVETIGFQKKNAPGDPLVETSRSRNVYTEKGRLQLSLDKIESAGRSRATAFTWEAGDTITTNRVGETSYADATMGASALMRVAQTTRDNAGRVVSEIVGEASGPTDLVAAANIFSEMRVTDFLGDLARKSELREPRAARKTEVETDYDGLGRPIETREGGGAYVTRMSYDEAGNMLSMATPGQPFAFMSYDARGLMWREQLPNGDVVRRAYDERGTLRQYIDEEGRVTFYDTDGLGRVHRIRYPDGTSEESRFEDGTGVLLASRDRAGQWVWFEYDAENNGRLKAEHLGGTGTEPALTSDPFTIYDYDDAGRVKRIRNAESAVELDEFDLLGRPQVTRTIRYRKTGCIPSAVPCGSGLTAAPQIAEVYAQGHEWSVFDDERERWRMPVVGSALPADAAEADTPWRNWIEEKRDGGANVTRQGESVSRTSAAVTFLEASARGMGRLAERKRASAASELLTRYGYADIADDGASAVVPVSPAAPGPPAGGLGRHEVLGGTTRIAGTEVTPGLDQRIERIEDYGLVKRESKFDYDDRGRLTNTILMRREGNTTNEPVANNTVQPAGFVEAREIAPPRLSAGEFGLLGAMAKAVVPVTWTADAPTAGGQITHRTFTNGSAAAGEETFSWSGGRRTGSGSWTTTYDARGRLTSAEATDRRIEYDYNPQDRLVGRIALQKDGGGAWTLETRANVLARDGLPASATFIWDPIVDRLIAVYDAEVVAAATTPTTETGLVRQYIHSDQAYDDPVEVLIATAPGATPTRYLPIIDEAGTGSLQAVADGDGNLVERVLYGDAYGDAPRYLHGAVVERIEHESVNSSHHITIAFSESIEAASIAGGVGITAHTTDGTLLRTLTIPPTLIEAGRALRFEVSDTDWTAFATGAAKIEIAVTPTLRFAGWGATPLQPAAEWETLLGRATSSADLPFIKTIAPGEFAGNGVLYDLPDLYLAARLESRAKLLFDFHTLPLRDPATSFTYVRARWYDASTGSFLTPDPMGYEDASNLYAYAGNDPVNRTDPSGLLPEDDLMFRPYVGAPLWDPGDWFFGDIREGANKALEALGNPYVQGTLQVIGGCGEAALGVSSILGSGGALTVPGAVAVAHGTDECLAGITALATGEAQETFFIKATKGALKAAGASDEAAEIVANVADVALGGFGSAGSMRKASKARSVAAADRAAVKTTSRARAFSLAADDIKPALSSAVAPGRTAARARKVESEYVAFYHGTSVRRAEAIRTGGIDLSQSRKNLDFGAGFYTTTDRMQAEKWASRVPRSDGGGTVLEFRVRRSDLDRLSGLRFSDPSWSLGRFVRHNRFGGRVHKYDFVDGPMLGNTGFLRGAAPRWWGQQTSWHTQRAVDVLNRSLR